ncbi:MAG: serine/threonine protein kinase [Alphaproteobacteria bacterium]|nr:serine/threonine protein kinase [Alphaproteobacteria bacterium]
MSVDPLGDHDPSTTVLTTVIARTEGRFRTFLAETRPPIHFAEVLGRGGEGVVRAAQQTSIGRDVAVKSPLTNEDGFVAGVLQEAWAAGALEHPNIVPIHDIVVLDGTPHVVMKRIQGLPWSKLLADAGAVESAFGESDLERWNLDVLVQVCHAVEYAHARGILHRDLKPDNVMIGRFGEVWLVDWGLAVRLGEEPARLPRAADQQGIHGTPSFMAPEMAHGDGAAYGTGTDVYLLGGILHLLVLGRPPHTGRTTIDALRSAVQPVRIPEGTPLRGLLERTLAMDVSERPSASDVRREIQAFLARRAARPLFERASAALEELEALAGSRDAERTTLYDLYGAARFGFSEARTIDAGLEEAVRAVGAGDAGAHRLRARLRRRQGRLAAARAPPGPGARAGGADRAGGGGTGRCTRAARGLRARGGPPHRDPGARHPRARPVQLVAGCSCGDRRGRDDRGVRPGDRDLGGDQRVHRGRVPGPAAVARGLPHEPDAPVPVVPRTVHGGRPQPRRLAVGLLVRHHRNARDLPEPDPRGGRDGSRGLEALPRRARLRGGLPPRHVASRRAHPPVPERCRRVRGPGGPGDLEPRAAAATAQPGILSTRIALRLFLSLRRPERPNVQVVPSESLATWGYSLSSSVSARLQSQRS